VANIDIHVEEAIKSRKLIGQNKRCTYYPCHFSGQDCTWCFCPFYPCQDNITKGRLTIGRLSGELVWSCEGCNWVHRPEVASLILQKILGVLDKSDPLTKKKLLQIRMEVLKVFHP